MTCQIAMRPETFDISEVYSLLYPLGITADYIGFFHTSYAVYFAVLHPKRLLLVTKLLYPMVAKHYETSWQRVERNIRTTVGVAWNSNRALLVELAQHPLPEKPTAARFLAILASSVRNRPLPLHGLCQAVAFAGEDDAMTVVDQSVHERGGEPVVPKDGVPL